MYKLILSSLFLLSAGCHNITLGLQLDYAKLGGADCSFNNEGVIVNLSSLIEDLRYIFPNRSVENISSDLFNNIIDKKLENRILGGIDSSIEEVPYQVAIYKKNIFHCGGSIITKRHVLTAAHCVVGYNPDVLWLRVGSTSLKFGGYIHFVQSYIFHEYFSNLDNDIAVIKTTYPFVFGPNVQPIRLPTLSEKEPAPGTMVFVTGWGPVKDQREGPHDRLMKVTIPITTRQRCRQRVLRSKSQITGNQICTITPRLVGTCFGDSGGPLVSNGKLFGIVSWGSPCAIGDPDVFTNVIHYLPWIYKTVATGFILKQHRSTIPIQKCLFNTQVIRFLWNCWWCPNFPTFYQFSRCYPNGYLCCN